MKSRIGIICKTSLFILLIQQIATIQGVDKLEQGTTDPFSAWLAGVGLDQEPHINIPTLGTNQQNTPGTISPLHAQVIRDLESLTTTQSTLREPAQIPEVLQDNNTHVITTANINQASLEALQAAGARRLVLMFRERDPRSYLYFPITITNAQKELLTRYFPNAVYIVSPPLVQGIEYRVIPLKTFETKEDIERAKRHKGKLTEQQLLQVYKELYGEPQKPKERPALPSLPEASSSASPENVFSFTTTTELPINSETLGNLLSTGVTQINLDSARLAALTQEENEALRSFFEGHVFVPLWDNDQKKIVYFNIARLSPIDQLNIHNFTTISSPSGVESIRDWNVTHAGHTQTTPLSAQNLEIIQTHNQKAPVLVIPYANAERMDTYLGLHPSEEENLKKVFSDRAYLLLKIGGKRYVMRLSL